MFKGGAFFSLSQLFFILGLLCGLTSQNNSYAFVNVHNIMRAAAQFKIDALCRNSSFLMGCGASGFAIPCCITTFYQSGKLLKNWREGKEISRKNKLFCGLWGGGAVASIALSIWCFKNSSLNRELQA